MNINNTFDQFALKLVNRLGDYYGEEYSVTISEVMKNNGNVRHALNIRKEDETISPNIYIDDLYDEYASGVTFSEIVDKIIKVKSDLKCDFEINFDFLDDYEMVKDKLSIRLIGKENNDKMLLDVPHTDFYDMTTVYYINLSHDAIGRGAILINNSFMKRWNISTERLNNDAKENMMKKNPPQRLDIVDMLIDMFVKHNDDGSRYVQDDINEFVEQMETTRDNNRHMYVLTNMDKMYGASVIVYPGLLEELADSFDSDYYLLPSSIHEVILIPSEEEDNGYELSEMVKIVNEEHVDAEDILSNHAYKYHRSNHWLEPLVNP